MTQREMVETCYRQMAKAEKAIAELRYALSFVKLEVDHEKEPTPKKED